MFGTTEARAVIASNPSYLESLGITPFSSFYLFEGDQEPRRLLYGEDFSFGEHQGMVEFQADRRNSYQPEGECLKLSMMAQGGVLHPKFWITDNPTRSGEKRFEAYFTRFSQEVEDGFTFIKGTDFCLDQNRPILYGDNCRIEYKPEAIEPETIEKLKAEIVKQREGEIASSVGSEYIPAQLGAFFHWKNFGLGFAGGLAISQIIDGIRLANGLMSINDPGWGLEFSIPATIIGVSVGVRKAVNTVRDLNSYYQEEIRKIHEEFGEPEYPAADKNLALIPQQS